MGLAGWGWCSTDLDERQAHHSLCRSSLESYHHAADTDPSSALWSYTEHGARWLFSNHELECPADVGQEY